MHFTTARITAVFIPLALILSSCTSAPFSYAEDRCLGSANQCRTSCIGLNDGAVQSACYATCQDREAACYATGYDGTGSALSEEELIGIARSEAEKEADYQRWKAEKARKEAEEKAKAEAGAGQ